MKAGEQVEVCEVDIWLVPRPSYEQSEAKPEKVELQVVAKDAKSYTDGAFFVGSVPISIWLPSDYDEVQGQVDALERNKVELKDNALLGEERLDAKIQSLLALPHLTDE